MTDNDIMIELLTYPEKYDAMDLVDLIKSNETILIGDRGFERFKEWLETRPEYRTVQMRSPVNKHDGTKLKQYSRLDVDESRTYVTAIRSIVEQVHGAQKRYKVLSSELTIKFAKQHFLKIHMIINGLLNCFGINKRSLATTRTFTDAERFEQLTKNNLIVDTPLYKLITEIDHDLNYKKRSNAFWTEVNWDDYLLRNAFFRLTRDQIRSLTGGPFQLRKSDGYKRNQLRLFDERSQWRLSRLNDSFATVDSIATPSISYKIEKLSNAMVQKYFAEYNLTSVLRFDINSYFAKSHKFKTYVRKL